MECRQHESTGRSAGIKRLVPILVILSVIAAIVLVLLATQSHPVSPGKAMSPPTSVGLELQATGAHPVSLDQFNLSAGQSLTKEQVMRVVKAWVEGNATLEEARLAIGLWRNRSVAASDH